MALTVLTAIHAGFVAATFWSLLGNALVATQVVEDGTMSSLLVRTTVLPSLSSTDTLSPTAFQHLRHPLLRRHDVYRSRHRTRLYRRLGSVQSATGAGQHSVVCADEYLAWRVSVLTSLPFCSPTLERDDGASLCRGLLMVDGVIASPPHIPSRTPRISHLTPLPLPVLNLPHVFS
jgi:hypothetical protein